jgi:mannose-1-phosphate guanylyltransferase
MTQTDVVSLWGLVLRDPREGSGRICRTAKRAARIVPSGRVVVVSTRGSDVTAGAAPELAGAQHVVQPAARGTAAETFLALLKIARQDAGAVVVVFPGHHHVEQEERFADQVAAAVRAVSRRPELIVLVGTPVQSAGGMELGDPVAGLEDLSVRRVTRFVACSEPAESAEGDSALARGSVLVARVGTLIALGRAHLPDVLETLEPVEEVFGRPEEPLLCDAVYEAMPTASFRTLLERGEPLAALAAPDPPVPLAA